MRAAAIAGALAGVAGCTVADLDLAGKHCPCAAGWRCETASDTCVRDDGDDDAASHDAAIDGVPTDGDVGTSCLGSAPGVGLYADDFADLIGWVTSGGTWTATGGEAVQSSIAGSASYAYPAGTGGFTDYRVTARMRRLGGAAGGAMAIGLRVQTANDGQYHCGWEPSGGGLRLLWIRSNGTVGGTLMQTQIDLGSIPGYDPAMTVTMEAQVQGSQITCCLREIAGATVTIADTRYTGGAPAVRTSSLSAAFGNFQVYAP